MTGETDNIKKEVLESCQATEQQLAPTVDMDAIKSSDPSKKVIANHDVPSPCLISGTQVVEGRGRALVLAVGSQSCEGRLKDITTMDSDETPLQKKLNKVATDISKAGLVAALVCVIILYLRMGIEIGLDIVSWSNSSSPNLIVQYFITGITILVLAVPEGLPLAVTISLAYSVLKMQEEKNLVRRLHACETMGGVDAICSDKTGTLTQNRMTLAQLWIDRKVYDYESNPEYNQNVFSGEYFALLKESICINSTAELVKDKPTDQTNLGQDEGEGDEESNKEKGNKTEIALLKYLKEMGHNDYGETRKQIEERAYSKRFNFSSTRKRSSFVMSIDADGNNKRVHVKGASEVVAERSTKYLSHQAQICDITPDIKSEIIETIENFNVQGLRSIILAYRDLEPNFDIKGVDEKQEPLVESGNLIILAIVGINDPIRPNVPHAVDMCKKARIKVRMVTGDNMITARAIAKGCNILLSDDSNRVMEGATFLNMVGGLKKVCKFCKYVICRCEEDVKAKRIEKKEKKAKKKEEALAKGKEVEEEGSDDEDVEDGLGDLDKFREIIPPLDILARSRPQDKYALVTGLRHIGNVVAVTGDGSNDAPALSKADIGFAMGIEGTDLAKESAGIILMDDNFASIITAVKWGRNIYDNIRKFIQFQLTVNVVACSTAIVSVIIIKQSPLTAVQILWVNLIMDTLASLTLATEPPTDKLLYRPPQNPKEYIVSQYMWKHIFGQAIFQCGLFFAMIFAGEYFLREFGDKDDERVMVNPENEDMVRSGRLFYLDGSEDYEEYQDDTDVGPSRHFTYIFNIFVIMQLFNQICARRIKDEWNILEGLSKTPLFWIVWFIEFGLQIMMVMVGGIALSCHIDGLTVEQWFVSIAFSVITIPWRYLVVITPVTKYMPLLGEKELDGTEEQLVPLTTRNGSDPLSQGNSV